MSVLRCKGWCGNQHDAATRARHANGCAWFVGGPCTRDCGVPDVAESRRAKLTEVRDDLRAMLNRWAERGVHATYDAPTLDKAILSLDAIVRELRELREEQKP